MGSDATPGAAEQGAESAGAPERRREQRRGKFLRLPPEIRAELERRLEQGGFGGYRGLSAWLAGLGYEMSPSGINYQARRFEQRLEAIRFATAQARTIAESGPEGDGDLTRALTRIVQSALFDTLVELHDAREKFRAAEEARARSRKRLKFRAASKPGASGVDDAGGADESEPVAKYPSKADLDAINSIGRTVASIGKLELEWAKWLAQAKERVAKKVVTANERVSEAVAEGGLSADAEARIRTALLEIKV